MNDKLLTCVHLQNVEAAVRAAKIEIECEGDWWGTGVELSVYFKCRLDHSKIHSEFDLPECVEWTEYDGRVAGHESGLCCTECKSFLVGAHPNYADLYPDVWPLT